MLRIYVTVSSFVPQVQQELIGKTVYPSLLIKKPLTLVVKEYVVKLTYDMLVTFGTGLIPVQSFLIK